MRLNRELHELVFLIFHLPNSSIPQFLDLSPFFLSPGRAGGGESRVKTLNRACTFKRQETVNFIRELHELVFLIFHLPNSSIPQFLIFSLPLWGESEGAALLQGAFYLDLISLLMNGT